MSEQEKHLSSIARWLSECPDPLLGVSPDVGAEALAGIYARVRHVRDRCEEFEAMLLVHLAIGPQRGTNRTVRGTRAK
jgi:hypothetical protein